MFLERVPTAGGPDVLPNPIPAPDPQPPKPDPTPEPSPVPPIPEPAPAFSGLGHGHVKESTPPCCEHATPVRAERMFLLRKTERARLG